MTLSLIGCLTALWANLMTPFLAKKEQGDLEKEWLRDWLTD